MLQSIKGKLMLKGTDFEVGFFPFCLRDKKVFVIY